MSNGPHAFVRNLRTSTGSDICSFAGISSAEGHANRLDATGKIRQVPEQSHEGNCFWSKAGDGLQGGGAGYGAAYRAHKKEHGVRSERKNAAFATHLLAGVLPK